MRQEAIVPGGKPVHRALVVLVSLAAVMTCSLAFQSDDASALSTDVYRNSASITLPGNGNASSYPSTINVPSTPGHVISVAVTFHGFSHSSAQSVNALLVSPEGRASLVMTGSCTTTVPLSTFVFSDDALTKMPAVAPCDKPAYQPTEHTPDGWIDFGTAAPNGPYSANFNNFIGSAPSGAWKLFIKGYGGASSGSISGGWSLTVQTSEVNALVPARDPSGVDGRATPYPLTQQITGVDGVITDVNVRVYGVYHRNAADLEMMLVSPRGNAAILMSDVCTGDVRGEDWIFDDEAGSLMSGANPCDSGAYRPVGQIDQLFPSGPIVPLFTDTALSDLDLTDPNGTWSLYVADDEPLDDDVGLFLNPYSLDIQTRPRADIGFAGESLELDEGTAGELTLKRSAGGAPLGRATALVRTTPGTAGADEDYTYKSVGVEFAKGEAEKTVKVETLADGVADPGETFKVELWRATGDAQPAGATAATVTIREPAPGGGGGQSGGGPTGDGGPGGDGQGPGSDLVAPAIAGPTLTPKRFRVSSRATATVAGAKRGSRIRYSLSEPASVTLRFQRAVKSRSSGRRRWVSAGTLRRAGAAGVNRVRFSGRIGRRALRAGSYRLILSATDAAGNTAKATPRLLRVVR